MILDIALIFLLIARPSQQLLLWIVALGIIRHWPWTANAVARQFELENYCGLTAWLARVALPGWTPDDELMSSADDAYDQIGTIKAEQRSHAAERPMEPLGSGCGTAFLPPWEQGTPPTDDELLVWLALRPAADGTPYYAESRVAKFIGGRVEDRIAQVRAVRGTPPPPKSVATKQYPQRTLAQEMIRKMLGIAKR